ncbi:MAG: ATP-binding protein, partial [Candidatus Electrothrix sp. AR1]|nr:ATP-binding protein [Candidatus Electrothrix sp. AR1]
FGGGVVHDIIFPRKGNTEITSFKDHNLWILDERLNFTSYVSSDIPLYGGNTERPDLIVYNKRVVFRGDNDASNPITIFEFKKPQRDDFVNPSSTEDPVQQIIRYVNSIRDGKYKTPEGRKILVSDNTPFYGYVVCDLTAKVESWLRREKNFTPMPDGLGWFDWKDNIKLYIEVISWDKVLKDATMRNQIFFQKLGI